MKKSKSGLISGFDISNFENLKTNPIQEDYICYKKVLGKILIS